MFTKRKLKCAIWETGTLVYIIAADEYRLYFRVSTKYVILLVYKIYIFWDTQAHNETWELILTF